MKITLEYLCSLDWQIDDSLYPLCFSTENNDSFISLDILPEKTFFKKVLNCVLTITDKKSLNSICVYNEDKLFKLYDILVKESNSIRKEMYEEIDLA